MDTSAATGRLPQLVAPRRYELVIEPDLAAGTFAGWVAIDLDVRAAVSEIRLHAVDLDVHEVRVAQGDEALAAAVTADPDAEQIVVGLPEGALAAGDARCELAFGGRIADGLVGLYRSRFTGADGAEHAIAATQFEAPHARRMLPCFDEPAFKAVFAVTLVVDAGLVALSNAEEVERAPAAGGRVRIRFADTIPMSTYLLAVVVGPLEVGAPVVVDGVPIRVVHVPGKAHLAGFASDVAAFALRFFADYYAIEYPAGKLDLVALPDFAFGAMENLGLVTFRESLLLVDPATITEAEATNVALTVVHEIAHMWFGDLVTMRWWNGIWLNEAFATFMEHAGVDAYRPEWRAWRDFAIGRAAALDTDALAHTRAVEYPVHTPEDAEGMFDVLTYQKGGSVVRMLEQWLGTERFRAGVRHYLDRHRFGNTETTDLWDAIESVSDEPVRRIMDSWIFQPGVPVVEVERTAERVTLRQRRFTYRADAPGDGRWSIPVRIRVHDGDGATSRSLLLDGEAAELDVPPAAAVVVNAGGEGFYRVGFPIAERHALLDADVLEPLERFALLDDAWAEVLAGAMTATDFFALAERFGGERDLVVWRLLAARVRELDRLVDDPARPAFAARVRSLAAPVLDELGLAARDGDDDRTRRRRGIVFELLGTVGGDEAVAAAARRLERRGDGDPELAAAAVAVVAHRGDGDDFDRYVAHMGAAPSPQVQLRYLYALGAFCDSDLVAQAFELAFTDAVRPQNAPFMLQRALRNRAHGAMVWSLLADRWPEVITRFAPGLVPRLLEGITWLVDDESARAVARFLAEHPVHQGEQIVAQHLERLAVHRSLWERDHRGLTANLTA